MPQEKGAKLDPALQAFLQQDEKKESVDPELLKFLEQETPTISTDDLKKKGQAEVKGKAKVVPSSPSAVPLQGTGSVSPLSGGSEFLSPIEQLQGGVLDKVQAQTPTPQVKPQVTPQQDDWTPKNPITGESWSTPPKVPQKTQEELSTERLVNLLPKDQRETELFFNGQQKRIAEKNSFVNPTVTDEHSFKSQLDDLTSKENVNIYLNNPYKQTTITELNRLRAAQNKEEIASFKQEKIAELEELNAATGGRITPVEMSLLKKKDVSEIAKAVDGLSDLAVKIKDVELQKRDFVQKKYSALNNEIADLSVEAADVNTTPQRRAEIQLEIQDKKNMTALAFTNDGKEAAQIIKGDGSNKDQMYARIISKLPSNLTPKQKFDMFFIQYDELTDKAIRESGLEADPNALLNFAKGFAIQARDMTGNLSKEQIEALELYNSRNAMLNLYLNNRISTGEDSGFWNELMTSFEQGFVPETANKSVSQKNRITAETLNELGINEASGFNKEALKSFTENIDTEQKGISAEKVGTTLGSSLAMMVQLAATQGAGGALLKTAQAGTLGAKAEAAATGLSTLFNEANLSKKGAVVAEAVKMGVQAEAASKVFKAGEDELDFTQFAAGTLGQKLIEAGFTAAGGSKVAKLIYKLGVPAAAASKFTGVLLARAGGEITEESIQQIVGTIKKSESTKDFVAKMNEQFPDMDAVTEFLVMTGMMGGVFGLGSAYSDTRKALKDGGFDVSKADAIVQDLNQEANSVVREAITIAQEEKANQEAGTTPTVEAPVAEGEVAQTEEVTAEAPVVETPIAEVEAAVEPTTEPTQEEVIPAAEAPTIEVETPQEQGQQLEGAIVEEAPVEQQPTPVQAETPIAEPTKPLEQEIAESIGTDVTVLTEANKDPIDGTRFTIGNTEVALSSKDGVLMLENIETKEAKDKGKGSASAAMGKLLAEADKRGLQVKLRVNPNERSKGKRLDKRQLIDWYKKNGFTKIEGTQEWIREPKVAEVKAETQTEPTVSFSELTPEQKRKNQLIDLNAEFNAMNGKQQSEKKGMALRQQISKLSAELGYSQKQTGTKRGGKIAGITTSIVDSNGKTVGKTNQKMSIEGITQEDIDLVKQEASKGTLEQVSEGRFDIDGMTKAEINSALESIKKGNYDTTPVKKLILGLRQAKKNGGYQITRGSGNNVEKIFVPSVFAATQLEEDGMTKEEIERLNKEEADLASQYDEWYNNQENETKQQIDNDKARADKQKQPDTKRESENDVTDNKKQEGGAEEKVAPKKASEKLRDLAAKVESEDYFGKLEDAINKKLGITPTKGASKLGGLDINDLMVKAIKATANVAEALEYVVNEIKKSDWFKKYTDEQKPIVEETLREDLTPKVEEKFKAEEKRVADEKKMTEAREAEGKAKEEEGKKEEKPKTEKKAPTPINLVDENGKQILDEEGKPLVLQIDEEMFQTENEGRTQAWDWIKDDPNISQESKDLFEKNGYINYKKVSQLGYAKAAILLVDSVKNIPGALDAMIEDIKANPFNYGVELVPNLFTAISNHLYEQGLPQEQVIRARTEFVRKLARGLVLSKTSSSTMKFILNNMSAIDGAVGLFNQRKNGFLDKETAGEKKGGKTNRQVAKETSDSIDEVIKQVLAENNIDADPELVKKIQAILDKQSKAKTETEKKGDSAKATPPKKKTLAEIKIEEAAKRKEAYAKWKKDRGTASASIIGLTQGDIEFLASIISSYVREGVASVETARLRLKAEHRRETGQSLNDAEIEAIFNQKTEGLNFEEAVKEKRKLAEEKKKAKYDEMTDEEKADFDAKEEEKKANREAIEAEREIERKQKEEDLKQEREYAKEDAFVEKINNKEEKERQKQRIKLARTKIELAKQEARKKEKEDRDAEREAKKQEREAEREKAKAFREDPANRLAERAINGLKEKSNESKTDAQKLANEINELIKNLYAKGRQAIPKQETGETKESYRERLIRAMSKQDFARDVWNKAKNSYEEILQAKVDKGEISSAEQADILRNLQEFFGSEVGIPFSEKLAEGAIKEATVGTIKEIVKQHYSKREATGKTLVAKIIANTGLSVSQATELSELLEKKFNDLLRPKIEKELEKTFKKKKLDSKDSKLLGEIIKLINLGTLNETTFEDAFAERYGYIGLTKQDKAELASFAYKIALYPEGSAARNKEIFRMKSYINLKNMQNQKVSRAFLESLKDIFLHNILGTASTFVRNLLGLAITYPLQMAQQIFRIAQEGGFKNGKVKWEVIKKLIPEAIPVYGAVKAIKRGKSAWKDVMKENYAPDWRGVDELTHVQGKNFIDNLYDTPLSEIIKDKDMKTGKKLGRIAYRALEYLPAATFRAIIATDAVMAKGSRQPLELAAAAIKVLAQTSEGTVEEKQFMEDIAKLLSKTTEQREIAKTQAKQELEAMKEAVADKPKLQKEINDFNLEQRIEEILEQSKDSEIREYTNKYSEEIRLVQEVQGTLGALLNALTPVLKNPVMGLLVPIVRVPANFINLALDYSLLTGLKRSLFGRGTLWSSKIVSEANKIKMSLGKENSLRAANIEQQKKANEARNEPNAKLMNTLIYNAVDSRIKFAMGATTFALVAAAVLANLNEDDEDDRWLEITSFGDVKNPQNNKAERIANGRKDMSYRVKIPGYGWTDWYSYAQNPLLISSFNLFGKLFDKKKYSPEDLQDKDINADLIKKEQEKIGVEAMAGTLIESMDFAYKMSFMLNIAEISKEFAEVVADDSKNKFLNYSAKVLGRTIASTVMPSQLNKIYDYTELWADAEQMKLTKAKDMGTFIPALIDNIQSRIPVWKAFGENNYDDLGQPIKVDIPYEAQGIEQAVKFVKSFLGKETLTRANDFVKDKNGVFAADVLKDIYRSKDLYKQNANTGKLEEIDDTFKANFKKAADKEYLRLLEQAKNDKETYKQLDGELLKDLFNNLRTAANNVALSKLNNKGGNMFYILKAKQ